ncbi:ethanolamine ammonia-lyase subunit EutB [Klenkia sp. PcliD-1-E]|uniref:ethanolamine ammonia-lyase subunit EutB n=1 Tax=Klenkia sp. PcliD-1-E TaxID=2954492 RepID=UPI0020971528|nr:ethanolamine ammonia-lyase subunit EutB [Klenkia sp. PcliD-1-E]MCO7220579.1 ethanolamine ammonia-lyase subunit EutB [Klenkia sp. PcliD-1-E]
MTARRATVAGHTYEFPTLVEVMAKATPARSGDVLAGCAATSEAERVAAQTVLADLPLSTFLDEQVVGYDEDDVTRLVLDTLDAGALEPVRALTVGGFREWLLARAAAGDEPAISGLARGLTPEMAAAVSKLMRNADLVAVGRRCRVITGLRSTIGLPGRLASRLQPNHPTDDALGVTASLLDGLLHGSGDAVIGINPATDSPAQTIALLELVDAVIGRYRIPTQSCVLAHVTTTLRALEKGAPVDLVFQSVAGTQGGNEGFGVTLDLLTEARSAALDLGRGTVGQNVTYFETGQGSALSAGAHLGVGGRPVDQQTLECRAYGVARHFDPLLVNTVVGFIGPEYLYDAKQVIRAGLEDHFCGKLLGLPMGVDVCYTNHTDVDPDDTDTLTLLLGAAGCSFVIAVPGSDDVMLHYQSLSFQDVLTARQVLGLRPAPEFEAWLQRMDLVDDTGRVRELTGDAPAARALLAAAR